MIEYLKNNKAYTVALLTASVAAVGYAIDLLTGLNTILGLIIAALTAGLKSKTE